MRIDEIGVFVRVLETGSFAAAARALHMPKATVSAKVAALEQRLGVTLIQRTTRSLRATPAGELYYERCRRGLAEIEAGEAALAAEAEVPAGVLRLTAPIVAGDSMLPVLLSGFLDRYPTMKVDVVLTDRELDLVVEGIDLAIRVGPLKDSSYVARRFVEGGGSLYASDAYLERHGMPMGIADLASHRVVGFRTEPTRLARRGEPAEARLDPVIGCNDFHMVRTLIEAGVGIGYLPSLMARGRSVRLHPVVPDYRTVATIYFAYPNQPFVPARVRHFIAYALEHAAEWEH